MSHLPTQEKDNDHTTKLSASLFPKIAAGDKDAFRILYEETSKSIYVFLLSITKNKEEAEDLLQETFIRVRLHADQYKDQGKPLAWMFTIARNLALMRLRELSRTSYQSIEDLPISIDFSMIDHVEDRMVLSHAFQVLDEGTHHSPSSRGKWHETPRDCTKFRQTFVNRSLQVSKVDQKIATETYAN